MGGLCGPHGAWGHHRPAPVFLSLPAWAGRHLLCCGTDTGTRVRWRGLWPLPFHPDWTLGHHHPAAGCTAPWDPLGIQSQRGPDPWESGQTELASWPLVASRGKGRHHCPQGSGQDTLPAPAASAWAASALAGSVPDADRAAGCPAWAWCQLCSVPALGVQSHIPRFLSSLPALGPTHVSTSGKAALYAHTPPAFPPVLTPSDWRGP